MNYLVDFDGTLAQHPGRENFDPSQVGTPIPSMVKRVREWLKNGHNVFIFTARVAEYGFAADGTCVRVENHEEQRAQAVALIDQWCLEQFGRTLLITAHKLRGVDEIWDDHAVAVLQNKGLAYSFSQTDALAVLEDR